MNFLAIAGFVFFTALLISMLSLPLVVKLAFKFKAIDVPNQRSVHTQPIARLGGLGIAAGLILTCIYFLPNNFPLLPFIIGITLMVSVGLLDDIYRLSARWKFIAQIIASAIFVYFGNASFENIGNLFNTGPIHLGALALPCTLFCMVGAINAFNLSDGLDGLAAGITFIATLFISFYAVHTDTASILIICAALCGSILSFMRHNHHPARLFMGDTGSLTLGFTISTLVVYQANANPNYPVPLISLAFLIALPLMDTLLVMTRRILRGESPFMPDKTHLHHRLLMLGVPHHTVVIIIYLIVFGFGILSVFVHELPEYVQFALLWLAGLLVYLPVIILQHAGFKYKGSLLANKLEHKGSKLAVFIAKRTRLICGTLILLLLLPAFLFDIESTSQNASIFTIATCLTIWFFYWKHDRTQHGILHGALYASIFLLLFHYNTHFTAADEINHILRPLTVITAIWVLAKIFLRGNHAVLFTTSFELLLLFLIWFLPFILLDSLLIPEEFIFAGKIACLESLPYLLLLKIYFKKKPEANVQILSGLTIALITIVLRSLIN